MSAFKSLPSLKERTITAIAIQLCQIMELKKDILFESKLRRLYEYRTEKIIEWTSLITRRSVDICERIPLPPELKNLLIARFRSVALQLFSWNRQQAKFDLSPLFADSLLTLSDWTAEGRLDEKKIAERLVQDERIPACQRFKMACFHCLELFIYSLWNQVSTREDLLHRGETTLVKTWCEKLAVGYMLPNTDTFWYLLFFKGVKEGSRSTMFYSWNQSRISARPNLAEAAVSIMFVRHERNSMYFNQLSSPAPYIDILYFLLTQIPVEQRGALLQKALEDTHNNILLCFVQWPYLNTLLPIIKELWNFLPVVKYGDLLLTLAQNYSDDEVDYMTSIRRIGYVDYDYGDLITELLRESPNHFKRYLFNDKYQTNPLNILYIVIRKKIFHIRNIKIFQRIWHHVTREERRSFLTSEYGKLFCCIFARKEHWELLHSLLKECLPEDEVAMFQSKISKLILNEVVEKPKY